jgi:hypothetical protein
VEEGGEELILTQKDLHAKAVFRLSSSYAPEDDSKLQLDTANLARELGLWKHSGKHSRS